MQETGERWKLGHRPALDSYRPWLDGVRALALVLVVLQHTLPANSLGLGGAGVGLFFALSGYLITGMLLVEHQRAGQINLRRFYLRRVARLAPALVLMVALVGCFLVAIGRGDLAAWATPALLYVGNYATVLHGGVLPIFGHTWSLAIEEHFYLAWPLALVFMLRRYALQRVLVVTLAACAVGALWRFGLVLAEDPGRLAYLGTIERADGLLYGCAAAVAVRMGWRPGGWCALVGAALVAATAVAPFLQDAVVGQGALAIGGALLVAGLDCMRSGAARWALSVQSVVRVGVLSYGIYLWHFPLLALMPMPLALAASVAAAWASNRWVERPIRDWARTRQSRTARKYVPVPAAEGATRAAL